MLLIPKEFEECVSIVICVRMLGACGESIDSETGLDIRLCICSTFAVHAFLKCTRPLEKTTSPQWSQCYIMSM